MKLGAHTSSTQKEELLLRFLG